MGRSWIVVVIVAATAGTVRAMCAPHPMGGWFQELEVSSCTPVSEDAVVKKAEELREAKEWSEGWSSADYARRLLAAHPGAIVTVRVARRRYVHPEQTTADGKRRRARAEPWKKSRDVARYFYESRDADACAEFAAGTRGQHFVQELCCDVQPGLRPSCLFGIDEIRAVPAWAEELIDVTPPAAP